MGAEGANKEKEAMKVKKEEEEEVKKEEKKEEEKKKKKKRKNDKDHGVSIYLPTLRISILILLGS
jgi:sortase (surface protein transpeptidase)